MRLEEQTEDENRPIEKPYGINCEDIKAKKQQDKVKKNRKNKRKRKKRQEQKCKFVK